MMTLVREIATTVTRPRTDAPVEVKIEATEAEKILAWMIDEVKQGRWIRGSMSNNMRHHCTIGMVRHKLLGWY